MTQASSPPRGDQARVSIRVDVEPAEAFRVFTEEIDQWWRRGKKYRIAGKHHGILHLEPRVGGRLLESFESASGAHLVQTGQITVWEPPSRLVFDWRLPNFGPQESTEVDIRFEPTSSGTLVTVTHRGWSKIRPDHPARHGLDVVPFLRNKGMWWADLLGSLGEHITTRLHQKPDTPVPRC